MDEKMIREINLTKDKILDLRRKEENIFENMNIEELAFERDKLKPVAEIYNEFNAMIREKQKEEN